MIGEKTGETSNNMSSVGQPKPVSEISIVIPTFNEKDNVAELVRLVDRAVAEIRWELIFVDDNSPDGTARAVRDLAAIDGRVRCIQRLGRRGLSSACIEGMLSSSSKYLAVMDGDLQHDEKILPEMLQELRKRDVDIVVATRYAGGGGIGDWDSRREKLSRASTGLAKKVLRVDLSDPMSGFFAIEREAFLRVAPKLSGVGFKILLDIFASAEPPLRFSEIPFEFRSRQSGQTKLDGIVALDFLTLLLQKRIGSFVPARFMYFCFVGGIGLITHMVVLWILFHIAGLGFTVSQAGATITAMIGNFALNNIITHRDKKLSGWAWFRGLALFCLACSIGAVANVGVASYLFIEGSWWVISALAGVLVGTVWNYAATAFYVWRVPNSAR
jgi:dolichol-phosphate mannosyltransferase